MVGEFEVSLDSMREVESLLTEEFVKGLEKEGDDVKVKMLVTYVHSMPDGTEEGDFLALDLGGSNFRVLLISEFCNLSHFYFQLVQISVSNLCSIEVSTMTWEEHM